MSRSKLGTIVATTPDAGSEIFVIDHALNRRASGRGRLNVKVPPGLYKIRFRSGTALYDELLEVEPGRTSEISSPLLRFRAAPPLADTDTTHEYHAEPAARMSRLTHLTLGSGSGLFIFFRDELQPPVPTEPTQIELLDLDGQRMASLAQGTADPQYGWAALSCLITPGTYVVRFAGGERGPVDLFVTASPGWQTQMFVTSGAPSSAVSEAPARTERIPQPADVSILMSRLGVGFDPASRGNRLAELARLALLQGRDPMDDEQLNDLLSRETEAPMVGLYGAQLLLSRRARKYRQLLKEVAVNLADLLPGHPDVLALQARLAARRDELVLSREPPMFWSNWSWMLRAAKRQPRSFSQATPVLHLGRFVVPAGLWLSRLEVVENVYHGVVAKSSGRSVGRKSTLHRIERLLAVDPGVLRDLLRSPQGKRLNALQQYVISAAAAAVGADEGTEHSVRARQILAQSPAPVGMLADAVDGVLAHSVSVPMGLFAAGVFDTRQLNTDGTTRA